MGCLALFTFAVYNRGYKNLTATFQLTLVSLITDTDIWNAQVKMMSLPSCSNYWHPEITSLVFNCKNLTKKRDQYPLLNCQKY